MSGPVAIEDAPRPVAAHAAGDVLASKYELQQLAGEGAMGEVWLAIHLALEMPVALKLIRKSGRARRNGQPTLARGVEAQLLREAQAIARFTHPNIVRVHDFGLSDAGDPFIVMERLEGEDLRDRLQRTARIAPIEAVGLALLVVHAMHTAHARGVVHRDLKPENIFLTSDDEGRVVPKVVDFGIADLEWETDAKPTLAGTPAYMAPEQLALGSADHRVDIWAMCVVLYEMLSGRTPSAARAGGNLPTVVGGSGEGAYDPPPLGEAHGVDAELWSVVARGLRAPAERYATMRELGEALARWLVAGGVTEGLDGVSLSAKWFDEVPRSERPPVVPVEGWQRRSSSSQTPGQLVAGTGGGLATSVRARARSRALIASGVASAALAVGAAALLMWSAFDAPRSLGQPATWVAQGALVAPVAEPELPVASAAASAAYVSPSAAGSSSPGWATRAHHRAPARPSAAPVAPVTPPPARLIPDSIYPDPTKEDAGPSVAAKPNRGF